MSLIHNEQVKLTAAWLNAIASGIVVTGAVAPPVAAIYGIPGPSQAGVIILTIGSLVWLLVGTALHFRARALLKRMKP